MNSIVARNRRARQLRVERVATELIHDVRFERYVDSISPWAAEKIRYRLGRYTRDLHLSVACSTSWTLTSRAEAVIARLCRDHAADLIREDHWL